MKGKSLLGFKYICTGSLVKSDPITLPKPNQNAWYCAEQYLSTALLDLNVYSHPRVKKREPTKKA